jgi:exonuclease III
MVIYMENENGAKYSILVWNTRLYEQGNKFGQNQKPIDHESVNGILNFVKGFLELNNSIAFLQEIPYVSNVDWNEHKVFGEIKRTFPDDEYTMVYNLTSKTQIMMSIVLSKKATIEKDDNGVNDNRCVSIKCNGIKFLNLHAKNGKETKKHLEEIKKKHPLYYDVILGDFNSGSYDKDNADDAFKDNVEAYKCFIEGYIDVCESKSTTIYKTPIDHVLIKYNAKYMCLFVRIVDSIDKSDHYPIIMELTKTK